MLNKIILLNVIFMTFAFGSKHEYTYYFDKFEGKKRALKINIPDNFQDPIYEKVSNKALFLSKDNDLNNPFDWTESISIIEQSDAPVHMTNFANCCSVVGKLPLSCIYQMQNRLIKEKGTVIGHSFIEKFTNTINFGSDLSFGPKLTEMIMFSVCRGEHKTYTIEYILRYDPEKTSAEDKKRLIDRMNDFFVNNANIVDFDGKYKNLPKKLPVVDSMKILSKQFEPLFKEHSKLKDKSKKTSSSTHNSLKK